MALSTWPAALHFEPEQDSLRMILNSGVVRQQMDGGNTLTRRRFTSNPVRQQFTFLFTADEYLIFIGFWEHTLLKGTRPFSIPIWTGSGYAILSAKFVEDPQPSASGVSDMRVDATLEIRGMTTLDEGASWLVGEYGTDFVEVFSDKLQQIVNDQMPEALANQGAT